MQTPKKADLETAGVVTRAHMQHCIERAQKAPTRDVMQNAVATAKQFAEVCEWLADVRGEEYSAASAPHSDALELVASHLGERAYSLYCVENKTPAQCEERQALMTVRQWVSWIASVAADRRGNLGDWIDDLVYKAREKARKADPKARID